MLYNQYRPDKFSKIRGQQGILQAFRNQSKEGTIVHSYLLVGAHGTGKTTVARLLGRAANCLHPTEDGPCNECANCRAILEGRTLDFVEIDAASNNGVEDARKLIDNARYCPVDMKRKVYIIDEVHMLSTAAFNAILKTLEEPHPHCMFILCTTELHKVPATIRSRCERYDFRSIPLNEICESLKDVLKDQGIEYEQNAVYLMAKSANGALRDALSILEQAIACCSGQRVGKRTIICEETVREMLGLNEDESVRNLLYDMLRKNTSDAIKQFWKICTQGKSLIQMNDAMIRMLADVIVVIQGGACVMEDSEGYKESLMFMAKKTSLHAAYYAAEVLSELRVQLRQENAQVENTLLSIIRICDDRLKPDYAQLLLRIRELENEVESLKRRGNQLDSGKGVFIEKCNDELADEGIKDQRKEETSENIEADKKMEGVSIPSDGFCNVNGKTPFDPDEEAETREDEADKAGVPKDLSSLLDDFDVMSLF